VFPLFHGGRKHNIIEDGVVLVLDGIDDQIGDGLPLNSHGLQHAFEFSGVEGFEVGEEVGVVEEGEVVAGEGEACFGRAAGGGVAEEEAGEDGFLVGRVVFGEKDVVDAAEKDPFAGYWETIGFRAV
jgi:hypothetical protein